jgi:hypothetical protein
MWVQYFAVPVPFLIVSFAYPLLCLRKLANIWYFKLAAALMAACVFVTVCNNFFVLLRIPKIFNLRNFRPLIVHDIAKDIASKIDNRKLILTLAPLYALEGGCDIYPELAAGPFVYRIAGYLSESDRRLTKTANVEELNTLVQNCPPSAAILGAESELLESPLIQAAGLDNKNIWEDKKYPLHITAFFRR